MDRGAWLAIVHGVTKSRTRLSNQHTLSLHFSEGAPERAKAETVKWGVQDLRATKPEKVKVKVKSLSDPMDCSLPSSSDHGIFQTRVLDWVAVSFSRRSSRPRDWTQDSHIVGRCFTIWATREVSQRMLRITKEKDSWLKAFSFKLAILLKEQLTWAGGREGPLPTVFEQYSDLKIGLNDSSSHPLRRKMGLEKAKARRGGKRKSEEGPESRRRDIRERRRRERKLVRSRNQSGAEGGGRI